MGECPFCGGSVESDILVNGGVCPHCLIEIPGEETPTDPGEAAQAVQQAEDNAARKGRTGPLVGVAVLGLALVGMGAWTVLGQQQPEPITIEMNEFSFAGLDAHEDLPVEEPEEATAAPGSTPRRPAAAVRTPEPSSGDAAEPSSAAAADPRASVGTGGSGGAAPRTGSADAQDAVAAMDTPPTGGQVASSGSSQLKDPMSLFSSPASKGVQAIELCSMGEIDQAVRGVMRVKGPQLGQCYNRALKTNENLRGTWEIAFEIQASGKTSGVSVAGRGVADAAFETCLRTQVERWTFPPVCEAKAPQPIQSPFKFGV